jgi:hypothetical protein
VKLSDTALVELVGHDDQATVTMSVSEATSLIAFVLAADNVMKTLDSRLAQIIGEERDDAAVGARMIVDLWSGVAKLYGCVNRAVGGDLGLKLGSVTANIDQTRARVDERRAA